MKLKRKIIILLTIIMVLCLQIIPAFAENKANVKCKTYTKTKTDITYLENGDYILTELFVEEDVYED